MLEFSVKLKRSGSGEANSKALMVESADSVASWVLRSLSLNFEGLTWALLGC